MRFIVWEALDLACAGNAVAPLGSGGEGGQWKVIAADWIVMPRARSAGRKSVIVDPSSTSEDEKDQDCHDR